MTAASSTSRPGSLAARFDPRNNSLNALRLLLAALVIVSHSWPLSGREPEPALGGANLGVWAVFGFFGISGFLITRSRLSGRPARDFYRARALRILPAFVVCLVVVAFVFAPLSLLLELLARVLPLLLAFIAGALVLVNASRIRINAVFVGGAVLILAVVVVLGLVPELGTLPIAFLLLALGSWLSLTKVGSRYDISYGIYIYGWPVQQLIALALPGLPLPLFILLALVVTAPLAWLSCALIERPALALKAGRGSPLAATS